MLKYVLCDECDVVFCVNVDVGAACGEEYMSCSRLRVGISREAGGVGCGVFCASTCAASCACWISVEMSCCMPKESGVVSSH